MATKQDQLNATIDKMTAQVTAQGTVEDGIKTLVQGLVDGAGGDPVKLAALGDAITGNDAKLKAIADAITTGTPVGGSGLTSAPPSVSTTVGGTAQLAIDDASGNDVTSGCSFTSDDASIATVDNAGLVTGVAAGSTGITASNAGGLTVRIPVTVS